MKWVIGIAVAAGLGAVAATIWVGSQVKEPTVVARPYEEGLQHDLRVKERARLGWKVGLSSDRIGVGRSMFPFTVTGRDGQPLEQPAVKLTLGRSGTGREDRVVPVFQTGPGTFSAQLEVPGEGVWEALFEISSGEDRLRIEERLVAGPCDAAIALCAKPLPGGGQVWFEFGKRPVRTMEDLEFVVHLTDGDDALGGARVNVSFEMPGMTMAENRAGTAPRSKGRYEGETVLVRCPSGRRDWVADVEVRLGGRFENVKFPFTVAE